MNSNLPPATEYEKEIRALYRERNERLWGQKSSPAGSFKRWFDFLVLLILMMVVAVSASIVVYVWLLPTNNVGLTERQVYNQIVQPELPADFIKQLSSSTATVFPARGASATAAFVEHSYLIKEALGQALVLSSDGWLVTTQTVVTEANGNYVVVPADGRAYAVQAVLLDPVAPLAYLKIDAHYLTPTPFVSVDELNVNDPVVVIVNEGQSLSRSWYWRYLSNLNVRTPPSSRSDLSITSESWPDRLLLDQPLPVLSRGAPAMTLQGQAVGLVADYEGEMRSVVPLVNMAPVIDKLFSEYKIIRPVLGINYIQNNWLLGAEPIRGAILVKFGRRPAVAPGSPADKAGLRENDIIVAVNGERLNLLSLSLWLQRFRAGETIELLVERAGQEQKVNVILGAVEGRVYKR